MTPRKDQRKVNGHAGPHDRTNGGGPGMAGVNGHDLASTHRDGVPVQQERAASDDASGVTVSSDTGSIAPGTVHQAYAEVAPPHPNGHLPGSLALPADRSLAKKEIPGGEFPLPTDPGEFVDEIHSRIDLFKVWHTLLESKDDKIKQRAVEKLTEMRYKGAAAMADELQPIIIDMPGPERERQ